MVLLTAFLLLTSSDHICCWFVAKSLTRCPHMLLGLPPKKYIDYSLRNSDTSFVQPQCKFNIFKRSCIN